MSAHAGSLIDARPAAAVRRAGLAVLSVPLSLFAVAFVVRLWAATQVTFPLTEGSAYYVAVARNLVLGRGLEVDAIWSYATPPLVLPRPAFELWQPLASFLAASPMTVAGPTFAAAQLGFVAIGALLAPLAWLAARQAAAGRALPPARAAAVAAGSGLLAAVAGPFVLPAAVPDSTLPFTVLIVAACLFAPRALAGERAATVAVGVLLGLAYLTRMEAVWFGLAFAVLALASAGGAAAGAAGGAAAGLRGGGAAAGRRVLRVTTVALVAGAVAVPWLLRNMLTFGSPFPGQTADNVFLARNEQIFAYAERPTLDGFLAQGPATIAANVANALWHDLLNVLMVPGGALAAAGLLTVAVWLSLALRRGRAIHLAPGATAMLLAGGAITYLATSVLFPVATLWGTFEHAAGPLLVGLVVAAVIGLDAVVDRVGRMRGWQRNNAWMAPAALIALTIPLTLLQVTGAARQSDAQASRVGAVAAAVPPMLAAAGISADRPLISDRPIWLADALARPALALPDEPVEAVVALANDFGAQAIVVLDVRGRHPQALRDPAGAACFAEHAIDPAGAPGAALFVLRPECAR